MDKFYVYALLDPRKPGGFQYEKYKFSHEPFYIGKGQGTRMYQHTSKSELNRNRNPFKNRKILKILKLGLKPIKIKIEDNITENNALNFEKYIIEHIGRYASGGPLTNLDVGGGVCPVMTEEIRQKIKWPTFSNATSRSSPGTSATSLRKASCDARQLLQNLQQLPPRTKISKALKGKRVHNSCNCYMATDPNGNEIIINNGLEYFCKKYNLVLSCVRRVLNKTRNHHKNWKFVKTNTVNSGKSKTYVCTDPSGFEHIVESLGNFCKTHNLLSPLMSKVVTGKREHHKHWKCRYQD